MSNQTTNHSDHEEIVSLLPWYVNQTLEGDKRNVIMNHIETCDECQREVEFLTTLTKTIQSDVQSNYNTHADAGKSLASVMNQIDSQSHPANTVAAGSSWLQQKWGEFFKFATVLPAPQWSATAIACLLVAVLGYQLFYIHPDDNYSVLSSSDIDNVSMRLSVEVDTEINQEQVRSKIQNEVEKIGQQVGIETDTDNRYVVVFKSPIGVAELNQFIADLENEAQILRVEILP